MNRSTVVVVLAIFLLGVLAGVAFAKWLVSAVAAVGVAVVVVVVALIAYYLIRAAFAPRGSSRGEPTNHRRWLEAEPEGCG